MLTEEEILIDMQVLSLQPGDIVVLRSPDCLSDKEIDCIRNATREVIPNNKIIVLEGNMTIGVIRKEDDIACSTAKNIEA